MAAKPVAGRGRAESADQIGGGATCSGRVARGEWFEMKVDQKTGLFRGLEEARQRSVREGVLAPPTGAEDPHIPLAEAGAYARGPLWAR